jgi:DNA polymerase elongation subunit (family B)
VEGREEYEQRMEDGEEGFEGAFVKDPVPGRYNWVFDLDLTSMYPNIIISLNISPETKIAKVENWNAEDFVRGKLSEVILSGQKYSAKEFSDMLIQNNLSVASNGAVYRLPKETGQEGTIPSILIKWFNQRKEMRKMASKYAEEKNWEMYEFYDQRQKVQKILLNSIYGCLGLPVFRFYDKDNAEAVTLSGVSIIKTANMAINQYYRNVLGEDAKGEDYVIYVDTDSCFASALPIIKKTMPDIDMNDEKQMTEAILKVTGEAQNYVNKMFDVMALRLFNVKNHRFDAKQEVISKSSFWLAKKRYCQFIINKGGVECDELEVKGIDVVRTSFPAKFRVFMKEILIDFLKNVDEQTINKKILDFKSKMKEYTIIELAKNTSVKFKSLDKKKDYNPKGRQPFQIISGTPAQVKAALIYNDLLEKYGLTKIIPPIFHGQKIKWVYVKQNEFGVECMAMKADGTDPQPILDFIEKYIDRDAMYEQELKSKLMEFYNVLKWDYPNENWEAAANFFEF